MDDRVLEEFLKLLKKLLSAHSQKVIGFGIQRTEELWKNAYAEFLRDVANLWGKRDEV